MNFLSRITSSFSLRQRLFVGVDNLLFSNILTREKHTIKTNRSIAKRFRTRGDGTLKRNKSGTSHNTGYKARDRKNRLGQSTTISNTKMEKKMKICMGLL